jgi:hypothetical protein
MSWTCEPPAIAAWYRVRRAVFRNGSGAWHEPYPIVVELVAVASTELCVYVPRNGMGWLVPLMNWLPRNG